MKNKTEMKCPLLLAKHGFLLQKTLSEFSENFRKLRFLQVEHFFQSSFHSMTKVVCFRNFEIKKIKCIVIIFFFLSLVSVSYALPDLQVWSLEYSKETGRLVANIYNQAQDPVTSGFTVKFYDNDNYIGEYFYNKTLPRYSVVAVYIIPTLSEGIHNFRAVADASNVIAESIEGNNEKMLGIEYKIDKTATVVSPGVPLQTITQSEENLILYIILIIIIVVIILILLKFVFRKRVSARETFLSSQLKSI